MLTCVHRLMAGIGRALHLIHKFYVAFAGNTSDKYIQLAKEMYSFDCFDRSRLPADAL